MGHRSVLFGLQSKNTWLEFPEASSMPAPGRMPDAIAMPSLKPSGATWGRWISGSREAALWSRGMSIRVPLTTFSVIGLDLAQQPEHVSQPRGPECWADLHASSPGVSETRFFNFRPPATHQAPPPDDSALAPPQRASEPHAVTSAGAPLCTTC